MPSRRRTRSGRKAGGSYLWIQTSIDPASIAQNGSGLNDLTTNAAIEDTTRGRATVIRMIGSWAARPQTSDADAAITMGILIMDTDAFNGGVHPSLEVDLASYMYLKTMYLREGDLAGVGPQFTTIEFDVKSKRKFRAPANTLVAILTNTSPGATSITYVWNVRVLLYVP